MLPSCFDDAAAASLAAGPFLSRPETVLVASPTNPFSFDSLESPRMELPALISPRLLVSPAALPNRPDSPFPSNPLIRLAPISIFTALTTLPSVPPDNLPDEARGIRFLRSPALPSNLSFSVPSEEFASFSNAETP
ncbi:hypothetical protein D3C87_1669470 [compost metagenome]